MGRLNTDGEGVGQAGQVGLPPGQCEALFGRSLRIWGSLHGSERNV